MPIVSYVLLLIGLFYLLMPSASLKSSRRKTSVLRRTLKPNQLLAVRRLTGIVVIALALLLAALLGK